MKLSGKAAEYTVSLFTQIDDAYIGKKGRKILKIHLSKRASRLCPASAARTESFRGKWLDTMEMAFTPQNWKAMNQLLTGADLIKFLAIRLLPVLPNRQRKSP